MTGNSPVCVGNTLSITTLNQPSASSYSWTGPGGFVGSGNTISRPNAQTSFSGDYVVTVTIPACGTTRATYKAIVLGDNTVLASANTPVCVGAVVYLSANTIVGATYSWAGPNGYSSGIQNPSISTVQPNQTGVYTVTSSQGICGTSSLTVCVVVVNRPSSAQVSAAQTICTPGALTLTGTDILGATLNWAGPNGFTASGSTFTIPTTTLSSGGIYTYTVATPGCGTATRTVNVSTMNGSMVNGSAYPNPICTGAPLYLQSAFVAGATYNWSGPGGFSMNAQNTSRSQVNPLMSGVYSLTVDVPGCGLVQQTFPVVVNTCRTLNGEAESETAPAEIIGQNFSLEVYPNPKEGITIVTLTGFLGDTPNLVVTDLLGHQILVPGKQEVAQGRHQWELNFRGVAKGIYFVKITSEGFEKVERVMVR